VVIHVVPCRAYELLTVGSLLSCFPLILDLLSFAVGKLVPVHGHMRLSLELIPVGQFLTSDCPEFLFFSKTCIGMSFIKMKNYTEFSCMMSC
jgi:hypothetical protein